MKITLTLSWFLFLVLIQAHSQDIFTSGELSNNNTNEGFYTQKEVPENYLDLSFYQYSKSTDQYSLNDNEVLDSIYIFQHISNDYVLTDKYYVLVKMETGEILNGIQFTFDSPQNYWINKYSDTLQYYADLTTSESTRKFWDIDYNAWIDCNYSKWNESGKILDTYTISRIYGIPAATYGERNIKTYDENNSLTEHIEQSCGDDLNWNTWVVRDYEYDENNLLKTYIFNSITKWEYLYNDYNQNDTTYISLSSQGWDTTYYRQLTYLNDSLLEELSRKYQTNINIQRDTFIYDLSEISTLRYYELWDTVNSCWETSVIVKHQYNQDGKLVEYAIISHWNGPWEFFRELYDFDSEGNLLEHKRQSGDSINIIDEWRYIYNYTENNNLLSKEFQVYDTITNSWENVSLQNNYWSILVGTNTIPENHTIIFPNPTTNVIYINSKPGVIVNSFNLFSRTGQNILNIKLPENTIDISNLKPGLYFAEIKTSEGSVMRKLIVQ